ncbi:hypothetical protein QQP08_016506 [Theobroma cacao]|nr:hypothetical protein QQP08_016506 [Theobroma cacao]
MRGLGMVVAGRVAEPVMEVDERAHGGRCPRPTRTVNFCNDDLLLSAAWGGLLVSSLNVLLFDETVPKYCYQHLLLMTSQILVGSSDILIYTYFSVYLTPNFLFKWEKGYTSYRH